MPARSAQPAVPSPVARTGRCAAAPPLFAPRSRGSLRAGSALGAVVLALGGALMSPVAAAAAPAPCEQAERYAAESGVQALRLNTLDAGDGRKTTDVGVAEAKSALVAQSAVNAAAVARVLDAGKARRLTDPLIRQAPPDNPAAVRRATTHSDVGPFTLGGGTLSARARWDPRMGCGAAAGEVTSANAGLSSAGIGGDLVRVPKNLQGTSTTALEKGRRTVASAGLITGGFAMLGGAVQVTILRPPRLLAAMSTKDGGTVDYRPAVLEVSGNGIETTRLDTPGDDIDIALGDEGQPDDTARASATTQGSGADATAGSAPAAASPSARARPDAREAGSAMAVPWGSLGALLSGVPKLGALRGGDGASRYRSGGGRGGASSCRSGTAAQSCGSPLPVLPGLPPVGGSPESAPAAGPGTHLRISLGDVRQATSGHAIAARATAIKVSITRGTADPRTKHGYGDHGAVILDLDMGVLEVAAVSPEPFGGIQSALASSGGGRSLPITGPRLDVMALGGVMMIAGGVAALTFGLRRRRLGP